MEAHPVSSICFDPMSWISCVVALPGISGAPTRSGARCRTTEGGPTFHGAFPGLHEAVLLDCHSTEKQKGELDLEAFMQLQPIDQPASIWESIIEQIEVGEMPPAKRINRMRITKAAFLPGWINRWSGSPVRRWRSRPCCHAALEQRRA